MHRRSLRKLVLESVLGEIATLLTLDGLLRADLNKLRATEGDTTDVCEDVVGDDKTDWQEEPNHALENVVHDKVRLHNDQVESHVGPGELSELELVVALLERTNEEHEACRKSVNVCNPSKYHVYTYPSRKA
jgi:hypothetical protein